jgi:hypothetical protein
MDKELAGEVNELERELLLSDDEIDLIWCLPYITEHQRLKAIAKAQTEKVAEFFRRMSPECVLDRKQPVVLPAKS